MTDTQPTETDTDGERLASERTETAKPRPIGINHVAVEVGDVEQAVAFYRGLFAFELRGETDRMAFLDLGDQFIALAETDEPETGDHAHFGLVVDDPAAVERCLAESGIETLETGGLDFTDPWGNRVQVVGYEEIQFTKADHVLRGMGVDDLEKTDDAVGELAAKGLAPDDA